MDPINFLALLILFGIFSIVAILLMDAVPGLLAFILLICILAVISILGWWPKKIETFFDLISWIAVAGAAIACVPVAVGLLKISFALLMVPFDAVLKYWLRIKGYASREAKIAAIALADVKRAEARADRSALKAHGAYEKAVGSKNPFVRYRASSTQATALHHERIVLEKRRCGSRPRLKLYEKQKMRT